MEIGELIKSNKALTKNPLGIIALFISLIYLMASLVLSLSADILTDGQKWVFVLFLVVFPPLVLSAFVWLVANHAVKLYSPSDFKDDKSYVELNRKLEVVEVRQKAAQIDPSGDIEEAKRMSKRLIEIDQVDTAKSVAKAFLKVKRYSESLSLFEEIGKHLNRSGQKEHKILSYKAYCLIGLERFLEASKLLELLRIERPCDFDFWPKIALSYCFFREDKITESDKLLALSVADKTAHGYIDIVNKFYPEIHQRFTDLLEVQSD